MVYNRISRVSGNPFSLDFGTWATKWNNDVKTMLGRIRQGDKDAKFQAIYYKNAAQLQRYYATLNRYTNARKTVQYGGHFEADLELLRDFRTPSHQILDDETERGLFAAEPPSMAQLVRRAPDDVPLAALAGFPQPAKAASSLASLHVVASSARLLKRQTKSRLKETSRPPYARDGSLPPLPVAAVAGSLETPILPMNSPNTALTRTVLVTSPRRDRYWDFQKLHDISKRLMPVWTWDELRLCHKHLYASVTFTEAVLEDLYLHWGGIPRYVLQKAGDPNVLDDLHQAIRECDLDMCKRFHGESAGAAEVPHSLMHVCAEPAYFSMQIKFASQWVADEVAQRLLLQEKAAVRVFLRSLVGEKDLASVRGQLFESFCHAILSQGGTFEARSLQAPGSATIKMEIPHCERCVFDHVEAVDLTGPAMYYRPRSKSFPSVDSLVSPNLLFQIAVSNDHAVKMDGLDNILRTVRPSAPARLIFVVPPDIFNEFTKQAYVTTKGNFAKTIPRTVQAVEQWVLKISLDSA
jgi:hypothetical protein